MVYGDFAVPGWDKNANFDTGFGFGETRYAFFEKWDKWR